MNMKRKKPAEPTTTAAEIRTRLGISERSCSRMLAGGLPVLKRGGGGRNPVVRLWDLAKFLHERRIAGAGAGDEDDPLLHGPSSPALEEYRRQKAREAKRDNDVAEGQLLDAGAVKRDHDETLRILREELEAVGRAHGPDVDKALRDAIARAAQSCAKIGMAPPGVEQPAKEAV